MKNSNKPKDAKSENFSEKQFSEAISFFTFGWLLVLYSAIRQPGKFKKLMNHIFNRLKAFAATKPKINRNAETSKNFRKPLENKSLSVESSEELENKKTNSPLNNEKPTKGDNKPLHKIIHPKKQSKPQHPKTAYSHLVKKFKNNKVNDKPATVTPIKTVTTTASSLAMKQLIQQPKKKNKSSFNWQTANLSLASFFTAEVPPPPPRTFEDLLLPPLEEAIFKLPLKAIFNLSLASKATRAFSMRIINKKITLLANNIITYINDKNEMIGNKVALLSFFTNKLEKSALEKLKNINPTSPALKRLIEEIKTLIEFNYCNLGKNQGIYQYRRYTWQKLNEKVHRQVLKFVDINLIYPAKFICYVHKQEPLSEAFKILTQPSPHAEVYFKGGVISFTGAILFELNEFINLHGKKPFLVSFFLHPGAEFKPDYVASGYVFKGDRKLTQNVTQTKIPSENFLLTYDMGTGEHKLNPKCSGVTIFHAEKFLLNTIIFKNEHNNKASFADKQEKAIKHENSKEEDVENSSLTPPFKT